MPTRPRLALAGWTGLVVVATVVLHHGGGAIGAPPLTSIARWPQWATSVDPVVTGFAAARLIGLATAWYLLAVTVAGAVLRALRAARLAALVDRATLPGVRRLLAATLSVSLAAGAGAAGTAGAQPAQPPPTVTMHRLPDAGAPDPDSAPEPAFAPEHSSAPEPAPAPAPAPDPAPAPPASAPDPASAPEPAAPPAAAGPEWEVEAGQCLWSISEAVLARAWGRAPTDQEIVPHWLRLIEANRQALADPGNPDLIYPGQVFTVPPPGPAGPALASTL